MTEDHPFAGPAGLPLAADAGGRWVRRWQSTSWLAAADAWVDERLAERGRRRTGPGVTYKIRFWSMVRWYPTADGLVWFKQNNPGSQFEGSLIAELARLVPWIVRPPLAVHPDRGWLLTDDQGPTLADGDPPPIARPEVRARLVDTVAELQRATALDPGLAPGTRLTVVDPPHADQVVDQIAEWLAGRPASHPLAIGPAETDRLRAAGRRLAAIGAGLDPGVALGLDHNDLQPGNVFTGHDGRLRLFDFGDALWTHPFTTLHGLFTALPDELAVDADETAALTDRYLEHWSDRAPRHTLRADLDRVRVLLPLQRFLAWQRLLAYADPVEVSAWADSPRHWLRRLAAGPRDRTAD